MAAGTAWRLRGGLVWQPDGTWARGEVLIARGRIAARAAAPATLDVRGRYVAPGFIDLHLWGEPAARSREIVRDGTTGFLVTVGPERRNRWLGRIAACADSPTDGAALLGLHLEGPYLRRAMSGALPRRWIRPARVSELRRALRAGRGLVRVVTLAPDAEGAAEALRFLRRHRIVVSLGHTAATATQVRAAIEAGAASTTHFFNRMRPREPLGPGTIGAALLDERVFVQLICDGVHVAPDVVRLAVQVAGVERAILVTDAVLPAHHLRLTTHGTVYTRRGSLAGSTLTMMQAVRNMVRFGAATLGEAVRMASANPARLLGLQRKGSLGVGQDADLVVFDPASGGVRLTMVQGRVVYREGV